MLLKTIYFCIISLTLEKRPELVQRLYVLFRRTISLCFSNNRTTVIQLRSWWGEEDVSLLTCNEPTLAKQCLFEAIFTTFVKKWFGGLKREKSHM